MTSDKWRSGLVVVLVLTFSVANMTFPIAAPSSFAQEPGEDGVANCFCQPYCSWPGECASLICDTNGPNEFIESFDGYCDSSWMYPGGCTYYIEDYGPYTSWADCNTYGCSHCYPH